MYAAAATAAVMFGIGAFSSVDVSHPLLRLQTDRAGLPPIYFEVLVNSVAAVLVAYLAGQLTERLGQRTVELEQKRQDLAQLRALTENILASLNSGLVTVDQEDTIIYFNRAAGAITGVEPDAADDRPLAEIFPAIADLLDEEPPEPSPAETAPPGESANPRFEVDYTRPDGESVYLGFSVSVLRDSDDVPAGHIVVFQDLTEIKRLEAAKQRSERLAAVGELAASIAHEIRNPLASISGSIEMLESAADLDAQERSLMDIVIREVDRLDSLISEFMDYSRPSSMSFERVDVREVIDDVTELFHQHDVDAALEVTFESGDDDADWTARIDRESLRQVLWNLLNNASDALDDLDTQPPEIRISVGRRKLDDETHLSIVVEDAGSGLPDEERERIFEPFFTTKEHGSGLGLATTHRLIEEHGGEIQIGDSDDLGGAKFTIWLPRHPDRSDGLEGTDAPSGGPSTLDDSGVSLADTSTPDLLQTASS
ncbi:MAG: nitrogen regulation protein NR(II) [Bradymonadaceae bacterium]